MKKAETFWGIHRDTTAKQNLSHRVRFLRRGLRMSHPSITSRLISAYGEQELAIESCKKEHGHAMLAPELENDLAWGIRLFKTLADIESRFQSRMMGRWSDEAQAKQDELDANYRLWLNASRRYLAIANELIAHDDSIEHVDEFRQLVLEAECVVASIELEPDVPTIEATAEFVWTGTPLADR